MSRVRTMEQHDIPSAFKLPDSFFNYDALSTVLSTADDALLLAAGAWQNISGMLCYADHRYPSEADDNVVISECKCDVMELASWWASIRALDGKGQLAAMALMYDTWHGLYDSSPVVPVPAVPPDEICISRASTSVLKAFGRIGLHDHNEDGDDVVVISTATPFYTGFGDLDFTTTKHQEKQPPYRQQVLASTHGSVYELGEAGSDCLVTIASGVAVPGDGSGGSAAFVATAVADWPSLELIAPALDSVTLTAALCSFDDDDGHGDAEEDFFWFTPAFGVVNGLEERNEPQSPKFVSDIVNVDVHASFDASLVASVDASTASATISDSYYSDLDSDSTVVADGDLLASGGGLSFMTVTDAELTFSCEKGRPLKISLSPSHSISSDVEMKPSRHLDRCLQLLSTEVAAPSLLPPPAPAPARSVDEAQTCAVPIPSGQKRNCGKAKLAQRRLEFKWHELQAQWREFKLYWQHRSQSRWSPRPQKPPKPQELQCRGPQPAQTILQPQRRGDLKPQPQPQQQRLLPQSKLTKSLRAASSPPQQQQQQRTSAGAVGGDGSRPNFMRSTTASALMATTRAAASPGGQHQASRQHSAGASRVGFWSGSRSSNKNVRRV